MTLAGGTLTAPSSSGAFDVQSNWDITGGTFTSNSGTVTFNGTTTGNTITPDAQNFYNLTINGSGGGWTLSGAMTVSNNFTLTTGTLAQGDNMVTVNGSYTQSGGTMTGGAAFSDVGNFTLSSGTFTQGGTVTIGGAYSQSGGTYTQNGYNVSVTGAFVQTAGTYADSSPTSSDFTVGGNFSIPSTSGTLSFNRWSGAGTSGSYYVVYDVYGLQAMQEELGDYFKLNSSISAAVTTTWTNGFVPVGPS